METTTINTSKDGKKKQWSKATLIAAVASGALTAEAANIILKEIEPNPEPIPDPVATPDNEQSTDDVQEATQAEEPEPTSTTTASSNTQTTESEVTPEQDVSVEPEQTSVSGQASVPGQTPENTTGTDPTQDHPSMPQPELDDDPSDEDLVDVIVEEIDPNDNDIADVINIDEISTVYTPDGQELAAAVFHDPDGGQALLVDTDGDNVYDVVTTEDGEIIAQAGGDIDVSDIEQMYTAQHDDNGYLASNEFDNSMNSDTQSLQDDILLS